LKIQIFPKSIGGTITNYQKNSQKNSQHQPLHQSMLFSKYPLFVHRAPKQGSGIAIFFKAPPNKSAPPKENAGAPLFFKASPTKIFVIKIGRGQKQARAIGFG
jgi:hypothetical protein